MLTWSKLFNEMDEFISNPDEIQFNDVYDILDPVLPKNWTQVDISIHTNPVNEDESNFIVFTDDQEDPIESADLPQYVEGITQEDIETVLNDICELVKNVHSETMWTDCDISITNNGGFNIKYNSSDDNSDENGSSESYSDSYTSDDGSFNSYSSYSSSSQSSSFNGE